jgi:hypothetical protein
MRLSEKSPLWKWREVICWLYKNKIVTDKDLVNDAFFIANINAVLEEQDATTKSIRNNLWEKISS